MRARAIEEQTLLKNQLAATKGKFLKRQLKRRIARIGKDIEALEGEIQKAFAPTANWPGAIPSWSRSPASGQWSPRP